MTWKGSLRVKTAPPQNGRVSTAKSIPCRNKLTSDIGDQREKGRGGQFLALACRRGCPTAHPGLLVAVSYETADNGRDPLRATMGTILSTGEIADTWAVCAGT